MNTNKIYAEHIANEYSAKKESKVIALKKLDRKAKLPANIFVYSNGIIMSLILGLGMCLSMNVIGNGKISAEMAKIHAETEFEKYRIVQDKIYVSDFDELLLKSKNIKDEK